MKTFKSLGQIVVILFAGLCFWLGITPPNSPPNIQVVEVPGPERVIHAPPDTAAIESLESRLKACEELSAARLEGWRKAQARYEYYEQYWEPKAYGNGGPQNGPAPPPAMRSVSRLLGGRR